MSGFHLYSGINLGPMDVLIIQIKYLTLRKQNPYHDTLSPHFNIDLCSRLADCRHGDKQVFHTLEHQ